jgi:hypothetical protein
VLKQPQPPREPAPAQAQQPTPARAPTGISLQALEVIHETVRSGLDSRPAALKTEAGSATAAGAAGNAAAMPGHDAAHRPRGGRMGNGLAHKSMPTAPLNGSAPAPADGPAMRRPAPMVVTGTAEAARSGFRLSDIAPLQPAEPQRMAQGGARR